MEPPTSWRRQSAPPDPIAEGEPEVCACPCHANPRITHVRACCRPCERCGVRYGAGLAAHQTTCAGGSR